MGGMYGAAGCALEDEDLDDLFLGAGEEGVEDEEEEAGMEGSCFGVSFSAEEGM